MIHFPFLLCRPFDAKNPFLGTIKVNRELHKGGDRQCMHIEFDIEGSKMRYDAGEYCFCFGQCFYNLVESILRTKLDVSIQVTILHCTL